MTQPSIRRKLRLVILLTSAIVLLLACGAFIAADRARASRVLEHDLSSLAEMIGANSAAPLTFDDRVAGTEVLSALRAGARGYLRKGAEQDEIVRAVSTVHGGGVVFGASLAARIAEVLTPPARPDRPFPELTERETEILDLIAAGRNNAQIAQRLFLSPKTIRNNITSILAKLQATDRADVIIRARDAGLGRERGDAEGRDH